MTINQSTLTKIYEICTTLFFFFIDLSKACFSFNQILIVTLLLCFLYISLKPNSKKSHKMMLSNSLKLNGKYWITQPAIIHLLIPVIQLPVHSLKSFSRFCGHETLKSGWFILESTDSEMKLIPMIYKNVMFQHRLCEIFLNLQCGHLEVISKNIVLNNFAKFTRKTCAGVFF